MPSVGQLDDGAHDQRAPNVNSAARSTAAQARKSMKSQDRAPPSLDIGSVPMQGPRTVPGRSASSSSLGEEESFVARNGGTRPRRRVDSPGRSTGAQAGRAMKSAVKPSVGKVGKSRLGAKAIVKEPVKAQGASSIDDDNFDEGRERGLPSGSDDNKSDEGSRRSDATRIPFNYQQLHRDRFSKVCAEIESVENDHAESGGIVRSLRFIYSIMVYI